MTTENTQEISRIHELETDHERFARLMEMTLEDWLAFKQQLADERKENWIKAKKYLDGMDFYDFLVWWYELEIKYAWHMHSVLNENFQTRMEKKCQRWLKVTDRMPGAVSYKLELKAMYEASNADIRQILKLMCALRGHATLVGVVLSKRVGECMFNTFDLRLLSDVRNEILARFTNNRLKTAVQVTS